MPEASGAGSLAPRVLMAWGDLRGSFRTLLARAPGEGGLLGMLMAAGLLFGVAGALRVALRPGAGAEMPPLDATTVLAAVMIVPVVLYALAMVFYALAMLGHLVARVFGGTGTGRQSRAAMAWAALVSAPVALGLSAVGLGLAPVMGAERASGLGVLGSLAFLYALAACFAEAHGFRRTWPVAAGLVAILGCALVATVLAAEQ